MAAKDSHGKTSAYTFQGNSPADQFLEMARIHHLEADQLFDRAIEAHAEDRQEESRLLKDLAISRRARGDEFVRAANCHGGDPIVSDILDGLEETKIKFTPYAPTFVTQEELLSTELPEELKRPHLGWIARAVAWVGSWIAR